MSGTVVVSDGSHDAEEQVMVVHSEMLGVFLGGIILLCGISLGHMIVSAVEYKEEE